MAFLVPMTLSIVLPLVLQSPFKDQRFSLEYKYNLVPFSYLEFVWFVYLLQRQKHKFAVLHASVPWFTCVGTWV